MNCPYCNDTGILGYDRECPPNRYLCYCNASDKYRATEDACVWEWSDNLDGNGHYDTSCGNTFEFTEGKLEDLPEFIGCPYCIKMIKEN